MGLDRIRQNDAGPESGVNVVASNEFLYYTHHSILAHFSGTYHRIERRHKSTIVKKIKKNIPVKVETKPTPTMKNFPRVYTLLTAQSWSLSLEPINKST
jgi:hypothetical protein